MYQLRGEYECSVDAKRRLRMPSGLLRQFGGSGSLSFVVNRGFEKCIMLYPKEVWDRKAAEVNALNIYNPKQRTFIRYFYRGASDVVVDDASRINLPNSLISYAGIDKDIILFAYHEQIEIWSKEQYDQAMLDEPEDFSSLAAEVFGGRNLDAAHDE